LWFLLARRHRKTPHHPVRYPAAKFLNVLLIYGIDIYRDLENIDNSLKSALDDSKTIAEDLLKEERNRLFNNDKEVFHRLAKHLETLQQDNEPDDEEFFDDDEQEETTTPNSNAI
jgi:hypothetical protein